MRRGGGTAGTNTADAVADRLSNGTFMVRLRDSTHRTKECRVVSIGGDGGGDGKRD